MLGAVNDFLLQYAPGMTQDVIYRGYQNRMALPTEQDYAVISVVSTERVGTNVSDYTQSEQEKYTAKTLREYVIAVDFCSINQDIAQERAVTLEVISNGYIAVDFFKQYEINYDYADDVEYLPFVSEQDQYVHRYRVNLHMTRWDEVTIQQQYAEQLKIRIENIDAHHKP